MGPGIAEVCACADVIATRSKTNALPPAQGLPSGPGHPPATAPIVQRALYPVETSLGRPGLSPVTACSPKIQS